MSIETVKAHYDGHLSNFYSWMFGDYDAFVELQTSILARHGISSAKNENSIALDLGSGSGFQSIALERLGYQVHAVDISAPLLEELKQKSSVIVTHLGDLTDLSFADNLPHCEVIVCMGDTLTHLSTHKDVESLLANSYVKLASKGRLILSFRDLSAVRKPEDRFIPVKSDENRILTCFLEDITTEKVRVFDLLYERDLSTNTWQLKKSYYEKLKITRDWICQIMTELGYEIQSETTPSGLQIVSGGKP